MVIAVPEITHFKLHENSHDFILMGCDGIFDKLSTDDVVREVWRPLHPDGSVPISSMGTVSDICGKSVQSVMSLSMMRESLDNLSVVMIAFKNFAKQIERLVAH